MARRGSEARHTRSAPGQASPGCSSILDSSLSKRVIASAVDPARRSETVLRKRRCKGRKSRSMRWPANPEMTPSASRRTFFALGFMTTDWPSVTWPSPAMTFAARRSVKGVQAAAAGTHHFVAFTHGENRSGMHSRGRHDGLQSQHIPANQKRSVDSSDWVGSDRCSGEPHVRVGGGHPCTSPG